MTEPALCQCGVSCGVPPFSVHGPRATSDPDWANAYGRQTAYKNRLRPVVRAPARCPPPADLPPGAALCAPLGARACPATGLLATLPARCGVEAEGVQGMPYYQDFREYLTRLEADGRLRRIAQTIDKDRELHPLVRWQYR